MNAPPFSRFRAGGHSVRLWSAATPLFALGGGSEQNVTEYNLAFMLGLVGVCLAVGLFLGFLALRARRTRRVEGPLADEILETMQRAMEREIRLDMYPVQRAGNANSPFLSGRCVACSREDLRLAFDLPEDGSTWPHTVVDVYFHEQENSGKTTFYAFTAGIRHMAAEDGRLLVDMLPPYGLRREQKRSLFRLALPPAAVHTLALWPMDESLKFAEKTRVPDLGRPLFSLNPRHDLRQISLLDISAGGVRLRLDAAGRPLASFLKPDDGMILLAVFRNTQSATGPPLFWFKCLCRHADAPNDQDDHGKGAVIGLQFCAWGTAGTLADTVVWSEVQDNGEVPPLLEWLTDYSLRPAASAGASETGFGDGSPAPENRPDA